MTLKETQEKIMRELPRLFATLRRKRRLTLRQVEEYTGIPNSYLSLLETGRKRHLPDAAVLTRLADCYGVTMEEVLTKAGYLKAQPHAETLEKNVDKAFRFACADPRFKYGRMLVKRYDLAVKRFVIELYEKATGQMITHDALKAAVATENRHKDDSHIFKIDTGMRKIRRTGL